MAAHRHQPDSSSLIVLEGLRLLAAYRRVGHPTAGACYTGRRAADCALLEGGTNNKPLFVETTDGGTTLATGASPGRS
ncbi:MAG TPA: hypothetical protein VEJ84_08375 [Acidimicrobiales bacterium]|nr:hypothetical protein [Acidimicrobiales bacterium]